MAETKQRGKAEKRRKWKQTHDLIIKFQNKGVIYGSQKLVVLVVGRGSCWPFTIIRDTLKCSVQ